MLLQSFDFISLLMYFLILALIIAVINFIVGLYITLKMASLRGLTKDKKPAFILNIIWSIITFIFSLFPWTFVVVFFIIGRIIYHAIVWMAFYIYGRGTPTV